MPIISRIRGGLGNQLFCYAAARRLSLMNGIELIIDDVSGFTRDYEYQRKYALNNFRIPCRKVTAKERLEPFSRYRRYMAKMIAQRQLYSNRTYIEEVGDGFDARLLELETKGSVYLDGLWQNEGYFKDVEGTIRNDLQIIPPLDALNQNMADYIRCRNAVALHVRWFDQPGAVVTNNISLLYYKRAIEMMEEVVDSPHYFLFSDNPKAASKKLGLNHDRVTLVEHNIGDEKAYADLWLMTMCQHYIIANSTFSWWGAWLCIFSDKFVIYPKIEAETGKAAPWHMAGKMPSGWVPL